MADPGFPRGGANRKGEGPTIIWPVFPQKLHEMKIWQKGVPCAPFRSTNDSRCLFYNHPAVFGKSLPTPSESENIVWCFAAHSLIFSDCSLIFFAFEFAFARCGLALIPKFCIYSFGNCDVQPQVEILTMSHQARIQNSLLHGAPTFRQKPTSYFAKFFRKIHEMEKLLVGRGRGRGGPLNPLLPNRHLT